MSVIINDRRSFLVLKSPTLYLQATRKAVAEVEEELDDLLAGYRKTYKSVNCADRRYNRD